MPFSWGDISAVHAWCLEDSVSWSLQRILCGAKTTLASYWCMRQLITRFGPFKILETCAVTWAEFERILPVEQSLPGTLSIIGKGS